MSTVPTFDQITKMRDCFNEKRIEVYSEEIREKIHKAVSNGEDEVLLYECKETEHLKIKTIKKILENSGWIAVTDKDYSKKTIKIYWNYRSNKTKTETRIKTIYINDYYLLEKYKKFKNNIPIDYYYYKIMYY